MSEIRVSQLAIYPVKSLAQISLNHSAIDAFGLQNDRRWMVVDSNGKMLTQRQHARMCLITQALEAEGLRLSAPGMSEIMVSTPATQADSKVLVWQDLCNAIDCGDDIAHWLQQFLSVDCRLVYFPDNEIRMVDQTFARPDDTTAFSDGFPILLISQASLDDLNQRLATPVPMARFRPNLVVSGCGAFAEDEWKLISIGDTSFRIVKPCSRCVIPSIDFNTAEKSAEPTQTLASYRRRDNKIFFGQNVIADGTGKIELDMPVTILQ